MKSQETLRKMRIDILKDRVSRLEKTIRKLYQKNSDYKDRIMELEKEVNKRSLT